MKANPSALYPFASIDASGAHANFAFAVQNVTLLSLHQSLHSMDSRRRLRDSQQSMNSSGSVFTSPRTPFENPPATGNHQHHSLPKRNPRVCCLESPLLGALRWHVF